MKDAHEIARISQQFGCSLEEAATAEYLGDSVYATHDGHHVWLRTFNGISVADEIALEPTVLAELEGFVAALKERQP